MIWRFVCPLTRVPSQRWFHGNRKIGCALNCPIRHASAYWHRVIWFHQPAGTKAITLEPKQECAFARFRKVDDKFPTCDAAPRICLTHQLKFAGHLLRTYNSSCHQAASCPDDWHLGPHFEPRGDFVGWSLSPANLMQARDKAVETRYARINSLERECSLICFDSIGEGGRNQGGGGGGR